MTARAIQGQIAGAGTSRGRPVQQAKLTGRPLDREGTRRPGGFPLELGDLVHRVEKTSGGVDGEKRRVRRLCRELGRGQAPACRIQARDVDAFARGAGVRSEVYERLSVDRGGREYERGDEEEPSLSHP